MPERRKEVEKERCFIRIFFLSFKSAFGFSMSSSACSSADTLARDCITVSSLKLSWCIWPICAPGEVT